MKVVHISSEIYGGAFIAALRLHDAMLKQGVDSIYLTSHDRDEIKKIYPVSRGKFDNAIRRTYKFRESFLKKRVYKSTIFPAFYGFNISKHPFVKNADYIVLHWIVASFLSIKEIKKILELGKPVFWLLHDQWPLTGGCHYSHDCKRYETGCGFCPFSERKSQKDLSFKVIQSKLKNISYYENLTIIPTSRWLEECSLNSIVFKNKKVIRIPYPIDLKIFTPLKEGKQKARQLLSLPLTKKLICFGASEAVRNGNKGWPYIVEAVNKIKDRNSDYELIVFGSERDESLEKSLSLPIHFMGHIRDLNKLTMCYNAADVFVMPSIVEAWGQTGTESLSCGTPVVGFNTGGIRDYVFHKQTGYLAEYKNSDDLANGILWVLEDGDQSELSLNARTLCEDRFEESIIANRWLKLFSSKNI